MFSDKVDVFGEIKDSTKKSYPKLEPEPDRSQDDFAYVSSLLDTDLPFGNWIRSECDNAGTQTMPEVKDQSEEQSKTPNIFEVRNTQISASNLQKPKSFRHHVGFSATFSHGLTIPSGPRRKLFPKKLANTHYPSGALRARSMTEQEAEEGRFRRNKKFMDSILSKKAKRQ